MSQCGALQVGVDLLDDRVATVGLVGRDGVEDLGVGRGEEGVEPPDPDMVRSGDWLTPVQAMRPRPVVWRFRFSPLAVALGADTWVIESLGTRLVTEVLMEEL